MIKWTLTCGFADKDKVDILLAHNPKDYDSYKRWGADIVFSGHTHGGMIRLFDRGIISTDRSFLPQYDGGVFSITKHRLLDNDYSIIKEKGNIFEYDDSKIIVSRGLSRGHIGFRLFNKPELVEIEFTK